MASSSQARTGAAASNEQMFLWEGKDKGGKVVIRNSEYWIAPDIIVSQADRSRFRLFGRNWNFEGRSAEICQLDWGNKK